MPICAEDDIVVAKKGCQFSRWQFLVGLEKFPNSQDEKAIF